MKIETKETEWRPIVVTIESRREALELFNHMGRQGKIPEQLVELYESLEERL